MSRIRQFFKGIFGASSKGISRSPLRLNLRELQAQGKAQRRRYYRRRTINKAPRVCGRRNMWVACTVPPNGMVICDPTTGDPIEFRDLQQPSKFWSRAALERVGLRKERHHLPGGRRETSIISFAQWELNRKNEREALLAA